MKRLDPATVPLRGSHLIEASAGTGKTYTLATLYLRLVREKRLAVEEILVVTYTRAATAELRDRIRQRLREEAGRETDPRLTAHLKAQVSAFDQAAIFTIHGFCQRVLQENAFESGVAFDTELLPDQTPLIDEVAHDFWAKQVYDASPTFVRYLDRKRIDPDRLASLAHRTAGQPDVKVLPEDADAALEEAEAAWRLACARAGDLWEAHREEVASILRDSPALHRNVYRQSSIDDKWIAGLDELFAKAHPPCPEWLEKLGPDGMKVRKNHDVPSHPFFDACQRLHEADAALDAMLENRALRLQLDLVAYAREELRRRKEERRSQSFDDLLHQLRGAMRGPGGDALVARIRERYRAALIDEFQDTDPVQYEIFERAWQGTDVPLFLIGDPKQAIYAFRGADVFAYMEAASRATHAWTLGTNWRSDPGLVGAVNTVFSRPPRPFLFERIAFDPVTPREGARDRLEATAGYAAPLEVLFIGRDTPGVDTHKDRINRGWGREKLPALVAAEIARFLSTEPAVVGDDGTRHTLGAGDVAVLCRTNAEAERVQVALRERGVPAVQEGDRSVFESEDAAEMERLLEALAHPRDAQAVRSALATRVLGVTGDGLHALQSEEQAWDGWLARTDAWHRTWKEQGFVQAFRRLLEEERVQQRLLRRPDGERRLTNLLHLGELLHDAASRAHLGPHALLRWFGLMRRDAKARSSLAAEDTQIRLESDARAVRLTTIHRSKGLEYPVVYCPFLWNGMLIHPSEEGQPRFHDPDRDNALTLDLGSKEKEAHEARAEFEALAENLRLLYVALTRAKHRVSVVWGAFADFEKSALGYVLHAPPDVDGSAPDRLARTHVASMDDAAIEADLEALAAGAGPRVRIRPLPLDGDARYRPPRPPDTALASRRLGRALTATWRTSSFSGLVAASADEPEGWAAAVGRDHDERVPEPAVPGAPEAERPVLLHDFPSGPRAGLLLHDVLEHLDYANATAEALDHLVRRTVTRYGFETRWVEPIAEAMQAVVTTPLPTEAGALRLAEVRRVDCVPEMEFVFPVAQPGADGPGADGDAPPLSPASLAEAFSRHAAPTGDPGYAERLGRLAFLPLEGYLRGYIDLVFTHGGRWYVVDWKSNHLGAAPSGYRPEALRPAMAHHHYYLQYHLYAVALHRHLALRLDGYEYDRHFGGVFYLFLRGMDPAHPQGTGVFFDRPSVALIAALEQAVAGSVVEAGTAAGEVT